MTHLPRDPGKREQRKGQVRTSQLDPWRAASVGLDQGSQGTRVAALAALTSLIRPMSD